MDTNRGGDIVSDTGKWPEKKQKFAFQNVGSINLFNRTVRKVLNSTLKLINFCLIRCEVKRQFI